MDEKRLKVNFVFLATNSVACSRLPVSGAHGHASEASKEKTRGDLGTDHPVVGRLTQDFVFKISHGLIFTQSPFQVVSFSGEGFYIRGGGGEGG